MDVANLISQPAPDLKRPFYSPPPYHSYKSNDSYFTAVPATYSRPPLSPPVEDQPKCTLPSISTLFEGADSAAMPSSSTLSLHSTKKGVMLIVAERQRISSPDSRPQSRAYDPAMASVPVCLPPTPPLRPGSSFHRASSHSPSASSVSASSDKGHHHHVTTLPSPAERSSISSQGSVQSVSGPYASPAPSVASYSSQSSPVEAAVAPAAPAAPTTTTTV